MYPECARNIRNPEKVFIIVGMYGFWQTLHGKVCLRAPGELEKSFAAWGFLIYVNIKFSFFI